MSRMGGSRNPSRAEGVESQVQSICEKILSSEAFMEKIVEHISNKISTCVEERLKEYANKVSSLEIKLDSAYIRIDDLEQRSRCKILRVYGLPDNNKIRAEEELSKMCSTKLNVPVTLSDLNYSYFSKNFKNGQSALVVSFDSKKMRDDIFSNKAKLKGTKIVIKEDLTPYRHKLYLEASKKYGVANVWTSYGKIIFKDEDGKIHKIHQLGDIM